MGARTVFGIVAVGMLGLLFAALFRRDDQSTRTSLEARQSRSTAAVSAPDVSRGRIVPLVVNEGFTGTAFIPHGDSSKPQGAPQAHRVLRPPTIRGAKGDASPSATPQLPSHFPHQLKLLGIEDTSDNSTPPSLLSGPLSKHGAQRERQDPPASPGPNSKATPGSIAYEVTGAPAPIPKKHTIVDGDTLPSIAERYYGDAKRAADIFHFNRSKLPSIDLLTIGAEIDLPSMTAEQ